MKLKLQVGYRHIDTALMYGELYEDQAARTTRVFNEYSNIIGTEGVVGEAIKESGIPREEIVITTKLP
jgi:diketogulonate reductase-like aldo/keto reductase